MDAPLKTELEGRMKRALSSLKDELSSVRTGRASTSLIENLSVDVYGSQMPLNQVATLSVPEARLITVQPWDKSTVKAVEKAIQESSLGLNPMNDGVLIRVPLPELTEDRRKDLVKIVHRYGEDAKIVIRGIRRDGIDSAKKMEKNKKISQDDMHMLEKVIQELTDRFVKQIDAEVERKEKDVVTL